MEAAIIDDNREEARTWNPVDAHCHMFKMDCGSICFISKEPITMEGLRKSLIYITGVYFYDTMRTLRKSQMICRKSIIL